MNWIKTLVGGFGLTQYLIAALAVALLGLAGLGFVVKSQIGTIAAQKVQLKGLADALDRARLAERRSAKAIVARDRKTAQIAAKHALEKRALEAALRSNRPWADQPVPKEVQDALSATDPTADAPDDHPRGVLRLFSDHGPGEGEDTSGVDPGLRDNLGQYGDQRGHGAPDPGAPQGPTYVQRGQEGPEGLERPGLGE
jgi:hypothetical protein